MPPGPKTSFLHRRCGGAGEIGKHFLFKGIRGVSDPFGMLTCDKVFIVKTDTGHVNVPKTIVGGRCEITTDTGDVDMIVN